MEAESAAIEEVKEIFRKLSPSNKAYLMALIRVAEVAENSVKVRTGQEEKRGAGSGCALT